MLMSPRRILTCEGYLTTEKDLCPIIHKNGSEHRVWGIRNTLQTSSYSHQSWGIIQENTRNTFQYRSSEKMRFLSQGSCLIWSVTLCVQYLKALSLQNTVTPLWKSCLPSHSQEGFVARVTRAKQCVIERIDINPTQIPRASDQHNNHKMIHCCPTTTCTYSPFKWHFTKIACSTTPISTLLGSSEVSPPSFLCTCITSLMEKKLPIQTILQFYDNCSKCVIKKIV